MRTLVNGRSGACLMALLISAAAAASCGGADSMATGSTSGGTGGSGGQPAGLTLALPQFVRGAARVDVDAFASIPIVVVASGGAPASVAVTVDGVAAAVSKDGERFVATVDASALAMGAHEVVAQAALAGGATVGAKGSLVVAKGSAQFTDFAAEGPAYDGQLGLDPARDALTFTWVSAVSGKHGFYLNRLDGAFARLGEDVPLHDAADEPLDGHAAFGPDGIGVVYRVQKPGDAHWLVKMRVVDPEGKELVPALDLTQGEAAFAVTQAGADPGGYAAAWLHIQPATDPANPPPVELRFARWDRAAGKLIGPITLDSDQPAPAGSAQGTLRLQPLGEIGVACNQAVCAVSYSRDRYDHLVDLNIPKLHVAMIDLASSAPAGPPQPVAPKDWDTQMFGHHLVAQPDGSFALVYTATDTAAALSPKSPCDEMLERDLLFAVKLDATGALLGKPQPLFDVEGTRQYPRIAPHPAGFALFWEDQRSECQASGHIRMAASVAGPDLGALVDPYLEIPGSIGLPPEDPSLALTGTSFVVGWSDDRHGMGLLDPKPEIFFDTYWRK